MEAGIKWISTSEKLPTRSGNYLCVRKMLNMGYIDKLWFSLECTRYCQESLFNVFMEVGDELDRPVYDIAFWSFLPDIPVID
jgi:hypothetical protein